MARCKMLTNSVSDLSPELAAAYDVHAAPDFSLYKDREYLNNDGIQPPQRYDMIFGKPALPSTSHPNPLTCAEHSGKLAEYGEILCFIASTIMAGAYDSAMKAVRLMDEDATRTGVPAGESTIGLVFAE